MGWLNTEFGGVIIVVPITILWVWKCLAHGGMVNSVQMLQDLG